LTAENKQTKKQTKAFPSEMMQAFGGHHVRPTNSWKKTK